MRHRNRLDKLARGDALVHSESVPRQRSKIHHMGHGFNVSSYFLAHLAIMIMIPSWMERIYDECGRMTEGNDAPGIHDGMKK